ncbi:DUF1850 domain-containing protein [Microvirga sp. 2MCAF38]|uniref:DUF1850 domain-containing protein n=1 Tax=Microvirga sp. 2MCAF38 TaxID=3232989 RepID=UPI003F965B70
MICLLAGSKLMPLMAGAMTLAWTHSVEKVLWEEDWRQGPAGLELVEARVRGSGAGMEPPPEARFKRGVWSWQPKVPPQREVVLRRSGATADWRVCIAGQCHPMSDYVPADADPVVMKACDAP